MQFAKDSFSMALRERLASLNPGRVVTLNGARRPAVVVLENELPNAADRLPECFYLEWESMKVIPGIIGQRPLCALDCTIWYGTSGTVESGVDRGRVLGELDRELFMICQPAYTSKRDFSSSPNRDLGTGVFWTLPHLEDAERSNQMDHEPGVLGHRTRVTVFFYPEVGAL